MKHIKAFVFFLVAIVMIVLSMPFIFLALIYGYSGYEEDYEKWMNRAPAIKWLNFIEAHK